MAAPVNAAAGAFAQVAVPGPHRGLFTYRIPPSLDELAHPGNRVLVPFGRRRLVGLLWERSPRAPEGLAPEKLRDLEDVLDAVPVLTGPLRELCRWVARYYHAPLGEVVRLAGPPGASWARGPDRVRLGVPAEGETVDLASLPAKVREVYYGALSLLGEGAEARTVRVSDLARQGGRQGLHYRLRLLERAGALAIEWERPHLGAPARERYLWEVVGADPDALAELEHRAPRQAALYQRLKAEGPSQSALLEKASPGAASALRALLEKGLVRRDKQRLRRDPWKDPARLEAAAEPPDLTAAQARALQEVDAGLAAGGFGTYLLWGVTGSGKTEVYLRAIERTLAQGRTAMALVPEIALTPALAARFAARFGDTLAILHSGLSTGERHDEWQRLRSGAARIALGVRSALFAPLARLGLIVVDEEHEPTYKQEEVPAYNARDGAVKRAQLEGALALLGSATPSLESLANVKAHRYRLLELPERIGARALPEIEIVDLRSPSRRPGPPGPEPAAPAQGGGGEEPGGKTVAEKPERPWFFSERLEEALDEVLTQGEQAIVYLNRRGFATTLLCHDCGHQPSCPNCEVRLKVHQEGARLLCHYCGFERPSPAQCESCSGTALRPAGLGTQQVERALGARFPAARIARLDRDALSRRGALVAILEKMQRGQTDILLGTQMVTKGHDFPQVTLAVVLLADLSWSVPDFRAEERAWQALAQVAGRAGRGERPGRVLVQSFDPQAPLLARMGEARLWEFAEEELATRAALGYPPAWRLAVVRVSAPTAEGARLGAEEVARLLAPTLEKAGPGVLRLVGPAPAPLARLRGRHRWQLLLKGSEIAPLQRTLGILEGHLAGGRLRQGGLRVSIDTDPQSLL